ncbi:MAG TPA: hypothetical protein PLT28_00440 [Saprospiraceae bacterium]|nr:hypothetical protein [Saprospiraceae bacterium]
MTLTLFIQSLTGKIYKILPLRENLEQMEDLQLYLASLVIELEGAYTTFPALKETRNYITIINTLNYFLSHDVDKKVYKREVFKMLDILRKIQLELGGE